MFEHVPGAAQAVYLPGRSVAVQSLYVPGPNYHEGSSWQMLDQNLGRISSPHGSSATGGCAKTLSLPLQKGLRVETLLSLVSVHSFCDADHVLQENSGHRATFEVLRQDKTGLV